MKRMIRPILLHPDSRLKKKAVNIENIDDALINLAEDMMETMYDAPGIGLAAPQIGILERLIVMDCAKGIKRLTSHNHTPLAIISDWSKHGSGFTLYEVTCGHPAEWKVKQEDINVL